MPIKLIAGLGNVGAEYDNTRHNVGFWLLDRLSNSFKSDPRFFTFSARESFGRRKSWLLKPKTFVNASGRAVAAFASYYKIPADEILIVHDDLDLEPGTVRLKAGGGHGGHNGLRSIISTLGTNKFHRLRVGIGHPARRYDVVKYVLKKPSKVDLGKIEDALTAAEHHIKDIVNGDFAKVMNQLHQRS